MAVKTRAAENPVAYSDIVAARRNIADYVERTPIKNIDGISVKLEGNHETGVFKSRGVANMILGIDADTLKRGVITASTGNHGICVATIAEHLHIPATVVVPERVVQAKKEKIEKHGAKVILHGVEYDEQETLAKKISEEQGLVYIPTANHPAIIAGQGTMVLEIVEDLPKVDVIMTPVGNGGLISGVGIAAAGISSGIKVIGVQSDGAPSMYASMKAGEIVTLERSNTIADGIAIRKPAAIPFGIVYNLGLEIRLVSDVQIKAAMKRLYEAGVKSEPSGAASFAAALIYKEEHPAAEVCAIMSGSNVNEQLLAEIMQS